MGQRCRKYFDCLCQRSTAERNGCWIEFILTVYVCLFSPQGVLVCYCSPPARENEVVQFPPPSSCDECKTNLDIQYDQVQSTAFQAPGLRRPCAVDFDLSFFFRLLSLRKRAWTWIQHHYHFTYHLINISRLQHMQTPSSTPANTNSRHTRPTKQSRPLPP